MVVCWYSIFSVGGVYCVMLVLIGIGGSGVGGGRLLKWVWWLVLGLCVWGSVEWCVLVVDVDMGILCFCNMWMRFCVVCFSCVLRVLSF